MHGICGDGDVVIVNTREETSCQTIASTTTVTAGSSNPKENSFESVRENVDTQLVAETFGTDGDQ